MRCIIRIPGCTPYGFRLTGGDGDPVTVARVRKESRANDAGLQEGDAVLAINGISCQGLTYNSIFGLTEMNDQELKLEILRGENAESNWKTALTFLDGSVRKLSDHDVFNFIKDKNKQNFDECSSQHVFQLQMPTPKLKLTSVPRIDVTDTSDPSINLLTIVPRIQTSSQTTVHVVKPQQMEQAPLMMKSSEHHFDEGIPFVSKVFQTLRVNGKGEGESYHFGVPDKAITFEFKAGDTKPACFESRVVEQSSTSSQPRFSHQTLNLFDPHRFSVNEAGGSASNSYQTSSSHVVTSNKIAGNVDGPSWHVEKNFTSETWTRPNFQVERSITAKPFQANFDGFAKRVEMPVNAPRFLNQLNATREDGPRSWAPPNILQKFNIGLNDHPQQQINKYEFESHEVKSPPFTSQQSNSWQAKSDRTFFEPNNFNSDFRYQPSQPAQMHSGFQGPLIQDKPSFFNQAPPPPPPLLHPTGGIPPLQLAKSPSDINLNLYSGGSSIRDTEKDLLKEKVQMAKEIAHSVLSPANKNSKGQKMFLKRRANSEHWTIKGPNPIEKEENHHPGPRPFVNPVRPVSNISSNFFGNQPSFVAPTQFVQPKHQLAPNPVQSVKWSPPFNPVGPSTISLGYCDL